MKPTTPRTIYINVNGREKQSFSAVKKTIDKFEMRCYSNINQFYIGSKKAMTKKAELQNFQRGGVWCEPSAEQFKAIPSEPKPRKLVASRRFP